MNPFAKITLEGERTAAGGSIVITQDSDMIALISKERALRLANEIRELANTYWTDDPAPIDTSIGKRGYNELIERGE